MPVKIVMPMIGWSRRSSSHLSHFGFCSSPAARNSFSMRPRYSPLLSLMRTSDFGLPVSSSMVFHKPAGEPSCAPAPADSSAVPSAASVKKRLTM